MKLIATSDTHFPVDTDKSDEKGRWFPNDLEIALDPDTTFVHCGDLMSGGYESEWKSSLDWLKRLPYNNKYICYGNHDFHPFLYPGPSLQDMRKIGVTVLGFPGNINYTSTILPNGMKMLALPFVMNLPRWAFNVDEKYLKNYLDELSGHGPYDIIISHSPPYGILDKVMTGERVGIKLYRKFLTKMKPRYWFLGHIHESYGFREFEGCKFYNVAMCNRAYEHANRPIIIDI